MVLNAIGAVVDREGAVVRGHLDSSSSERTSFMTDIERRVAAAQKPPSSQPGNTTITVVVTNARVGNLEQLARQVHSSMARGIQPFHTDTDGDALWMVSTGEEDLSVWSQTAIGVVASEVVWDAILAAHP